MTCFPKNQPIWWHPKRCFKRCSIYPKSNIQPLRPIFSIRSNYILKYFFDLPITYLDLSISLRMVKCADSMMDFISLQWWSELIISKKGSSITNYRSRRSKIRKYVMFYELHNDFAIAGSCRNVLHPSRYIIHYH